MSTRQDLPFLTLAVAAEQAAIEMGGNTQEYYAVWKGVFLSLTLIVQPRAYLPTGVMCALYAFAVVTFIPGSVHFYRAQRRGNASETSGPERDSTVRTRAQASLCVVLVVLGLLASVLLQFLYHDRGMYVSFRLWANGN